MRAGDGVPGMRGAHTTLSAAGQKSYWERFHGDVTVNVTSWPSLARSGAWGRALQQRFRGAIQNVNIGCYIGAGNGYVEGREIRHLRLLARHGFRMVRLLSLRHPGAVLRRAVLSSRQ